MVPIKDFDGYYITNGKAIKIIAAIANKTLSTVKPFLILEFELFFIFLLLFNV